MTEMLAADLDAIRALAAKQYRSAMALRTIEVAPAVGALESGMAGSDTASECTRAAAAIAAALNVVASRVEVLADANLTAARDIGIADDEYAARIHSAVTAA